jgi:DNA polymerase elongation subunit (family B)
MGFRNIWYSNKTGSIHLWTWDEQGNRVEYATSFEPYFFIESNDPADGISIFRTNLKKIKFETNYDRKKYIESSPIKKIYHNLNPEQQFLLDYYKNGINDSNPLRIFYFDIETYAKDRKFSTPEEARDPINLITIYDSLSKNFYTWGLKNSYYNKEENIKYIKCNSEKELLVLFLKFWKENYPDVVTGWNSHGYDMPYIINRIEKILGENKNIKLSPVNKIWLQPKAAVNLKGQRKDRWIVYGISHLDYMDVYQTFALGDRESWSLNYISSYELGEEKVAYNTVSLSDLADTDWQTFVDYNIQDVKLLIKLEEKLKYLKLIQNLAYKGFVPFEKAMAKVQLITGAVAFQAMQDGMYIPTYNVNNKKESFEGGYVKEPVPNLYENIVTYDANSLYPNTIITLNISPETKIAKIKSTENNLYKLKLSTGKEVSLTQDNFKKLIKKEKLSISKANVLYSQKFKGVIPKFVDNLYKQRVEAKKQKEKYEKLLIKEKDPLKKEKYKQYITDNNILSDVYKVVLNSCYGVFSQIYSPLFDIDHAESITLTGQASVKQGSQIIYEKFLKDGIKCEYDDIIRYSDTDSCFIDFTKALQFFNINLTDSNKIITEQANLLIDRYGEHLNEQIQIWAKTQLNSADPRYYFKREKICDIAVLQKKKFYILHILDKEGIPTNEFLYKGIEVAKSILSDDVKKLIKNSIETAILSKNKQRSMEIFNESFEKFLNFSEDQISVRKKVNDYDKGQNGYINGKYAKGTPNHTKAAINYNELLKTLNLDNKYLKIGNGQKFKFFYCEKNKFGYSNMGFFNEYPKEFKKFISPDYRLMFEKTVSPIIGRVYKIIGWPNPKIGFDYKIDLFNFFSDKNIDF